MNFNNRGIRFSESYLHRTIIEEDDINVK